MFFSRKTQRHKGVLPKLVYKFYVISLNYKLTLETRQVYFKVQVEKVKKQEQRLGAVVHTLILALWEAEESGSLELRSLKPPWSTW